MNPNLHYILVNFHVNAGRMGSLDGHFITTPAKLERIKQLPETHFYEALGKHSELFISWNEEGLLTVVSDDQDFIRKAAEVFKADKNSGHLMGFYPFENLLVYGDDGAEWEHGEEVIPVPWFPLNAPDPE